MNIPPGIKDTGNAFVGVSATTVPFWGEFAAVITGIDSFLIMIGGAVLLALTIWSKIMDVKIKKRQLQNLDAD